VAWFVLDVTNPASPTIAAQGSIDNVNFDYFYASVAADASGDFVIGFNGSGPSQNVSSYAVVCNSSYICTSPMLLKAGGGNAYSLTGGGRNRWGDFSATVVDPTTPGFFWTFQETPLSNSSWGTQITEIGVGVPEPSTLVLVGLAGLCFFGARHLHKER
jgi:hypothetical protein